MKKFSLLLLSLLICLSVVSCASNYSSGNKGSIQEDAGVDWTTPGGGSENKDTESADFKDFERKIIKDASFDLEVIDVPKSYEELLNWATQRGGYEINRSQQKYNDLVSIDAVIRLEPQYLDEFLDFAATVGDVINTHIFTDDITDQYYDAESRLRSMEASRERYYEFLQQAENVEEILSVQSEINNLSAEIDSLKGRIKLWDSLLTESTVTVRLRQVNDPAKIRREIRWSTLSLSDMGYLMKTGLQRLANLLVSIAQWAAIVIVVSSPVWIIVLVVLLIVFRRKRKKRLPPADQP